MRNLLLTTISLCGICILAAAAQPPVALTYATISGTVSRDNGMLGLFTPIPGATVYLEKPLLILVNMQIPTPAPLYSVVDSAKSGTDGKYTLDSVPAGVTAYRLTFAAKGYVTSQIVTAIQRDTVINAKLKAVSAFFSLAGRVGWDCPYCGMMLEPPVPGCTVAVKFPLLILPQSLRNAIVPPVRQISYSAITDANGRYLIDSIPADSGDEVSDSVLISAYETGYQTQTFKAVLHAKKADTFDFILQRSPVGTIRPGSSGRSGRITMRYADGTLLLHVHQSQLLSINVYGVDGRLVRRIFDRRFLNAGSYRFCLGRSLCSPGAVLIRASGPDYNETLEIYPK